MSVLNIPAGELNRLFPIAAICVYEKAIVVSRSSTLPDVLKRIHAKRGKVSRLSRRSLSKLAFLVACSPATFYSILTLTFGQNYPLSGKVVKAMLHKFLIYLRRKFGDFEYYWFLEFQRRGAPHFHLVTSLVGPSRVQRDVMACLWAKVCEPYDLAYTAIKAPYGAKNATVGETTQQATIRQHRRVRTWESLRSEDGAARYALKYALKTRQKVVPKNYRDVGRFWGISPGAKPLPGTPMMATEEQVKQLLWLKGRDFSSWEMLPKYIYI